MSPERNQFAERLRPNLEAALTWIAEYGDFDRDGYVEYLCRSTRGIKNQGWKDSADSATHRNGRRAEPPPTPVTSRPTS